MAEDPHVLSQFSKAFRKFLVRIVARYGNVILDAPANC